ncbi:hypothetical protein [Streptomyces roseicoloratus]|uniref:Uncharacterized protein n=1 Tax=Streptomyces roseicoloratus TaxID=2508722 RepID=A0ABY9RUC8_9ACTN|nr:hypothetical protein [Streptomyces roseicoloratus]WMX45804.1 hypothetical protein RGF97_14360 [Streptomyces roseicoloratus]
MSDDEPVFIRSKWGTNRYVYNPNNPVGLALIAITLLVGLGALVIHEFESTWSEGELRDAVRSANRTLDGGIHDPYRHFSISSQIQDAIEQSGEGPDRGVEVDEEGDGLYEITTVDTKGEFCMRVTATITEKDPVSEIFAERTLRTSVTEGPC